MTIGGGLFVTGDSGASAMPSSSFLHCAGCERLAILSKWRYKLQRLTSEDMLIVGTEHSWLVILGVRAGLSTAAVPFEFVDSYMRENGSGNIVNTDSNALFLTHILVKKNGNGTRIHSTFICLDVHICPNLIGWSSFQRKCSSRFLVTQKSSRGTLYGHCGGLLLWLPPPKAVLSATPSLTAVLGLW